MKLGDKVRVLPNKKIGTVTRIDGDFIYLDNVNRPFVEEQLLIVLEANDVWDNKPIKKDEVISNDTI